MYIWKKHKKKRWDK